MAVGIDKKYTCWRHSNCMDGHCQASNAAALPWNSMVVLFAWKCWQGTIHAGHVYYYH